MTNNSALWTELHKYASDLAGLYAQAMVLEALDGMEGVSDDVSRMYIGHLYDTIVKTTDEFIDLNERMLNVIGSSYENE